MKTLIKIVLLLILVCGISATTTTLPTTTTCAEFRTALVNGPSDTIILSSDIDCSTVPNFTPIPTFNGVLDGANHVIKYLTISENANDVALIKLATNAIIKNLRFANVSITASTSTSGSRVAVVIAEAVNVWMEYVNIGSCDSTSQNSVIGRFRVGGLIGKATDSTIKFSTVSDLSITPLNPNIATSLGGIIGYANNTNITDCHNYGYISNPSATILTGSNLGGIIGQAEGCILYKLGTARGKISVINGNGGAIAGIVKNGEFSQIYSRPEVFIALANNQVGGGLVGSFQMTTKNITIDNIYSRAKVQATSTGGGMFGTITVTQPYVATFKHCYSAPVLTGPTISTGIVAGANLLNSVIDFNLVFALNNPGYNIIGSNNGTILNPPIMVADEAELLGNITANFSPAIWDDTRLDVEQTTCIAAQTTFTPTTVNPTTFEPTTEVPTTFEPTTEVPTTFEPTTEVPTTYTPTTFEPTTEVPTTFEPTTEVPTTFEPTTEVPTTFEPTTEVPTTFEPTTEVPTTYTPTTFEPTTEVPTTFEPTTEVPTTFEPTTEVPTTFKPTTFEPTTPAPTIQPTINPTIPPGGLGDALYTLSLVKDGLKCSALTPSTFNSYDFSQCYPTATSIPDIFQGFCVENANGITITIVQVYNATDSQSQFTFKFDFAFSVLFIIHRCQNPLNGENRVCGFISTPTVDCDNDYCDNTEYVEDCTSPTPVYPTVTATSTLFYYSAGAPDLCKNGTTCCAGLTDHCAKKKKKQFDILF